VKVPVSQVTALKEFLKTNFQHSELIEEHYGRLTYRIPANEIPLSKVFELFESKRQALSIEDYSFSQTTLEQVFITLAKKQDS